MIAGFAEGRRAFDAAASDLHVLRFSGGAPRADADLMLGEAFRLAVDARKLPAGVARMLHTAALSAPRAASATGAGRVAHDGRANSGGTWAKPEMVAPPGRLPVGDGVAAPRVLRGRFVLEAEVGHGGMGVVYRAVDRWRATGRSGPACVALKVLKPALTSCDSAIRALEAEARLMQRLRHPNILAVHDFDQDGGDVFMVMEYLVGCSVDVLLKKHPDFAGSALARRALDDLLAGLAKAHSHGVAHADIKPSNLFVCTTGQLKLLDFGIAAGPGAGHCDIDVATAITPAYASPERLASGVRSLRDDIYAVGCLVHLLVTGRHPFDRLSAFEAQARGIKPPHLSGLPVAAQNMVNRALSFDAERRPADAGEMLGVFGP